MSAVYPPAADRARAATPGACDALPGRGTGGTNQLKHCDAVLFLGRFYIHRRRSRTSITWNRPRSPRRTGSWPKSSRRPIGVGFGPGTPHDVYFLSDFEAGFLTAFLGYTNARGADGHPLTWLTPATQLHALLTPDARSQHAYEFIASKAAELLRGEVVEYGIPQRYLLASERLDNFKRALQRVVAGKALYVSLGARRFSVQLRPEGFDG